MRYVRAILEWHGDSPAELAELLGRSRDVTYKKLVGARNFTPSDMLRIADHYGVDPGLLLRPDPSVLAPALGLLTCRKCQAPQVTAYPFRWAERLEGEFPLSQSSIAA